LTDFRNHREGILTGLILLEGPSFMGYFAPLSVLQNVKCQTLEGMLKDEIERTWKGKVMPNLGIIHTYPWRD
jgi:hypothetical protein